MDGWGRDCGGNVGKMLARWTIDDGPLKVPVYRPSSAVYGHILNCLAQALSRFARHTSHTGHCDDFSIRRVRRAGW
jgi:hypothetical protein